MFIPSESTILSYEDAVSLLEQAESKIDQSYDIGTANVYRLRHATGFATLVVNASGPSLLVQC